MYLCDEVESLMTGHFRTSHVVELMAGIIWRIWQVQYRQFTVKFCKSDRAEIPREFWTSFPTYLAVAFIKYCKKKFWKKKNQRYSDG